MIFSCGITTFNPTPSDIEHIVTLSEVFNKIIVYDNTPSGMSPIYKNSLTGHNIIVVSNGVNDGLSLAFEYMFSYFSKLNADFVCLFDQDSRISLSALESMMNRIMSDNNDKVAIYAPRIIYEHESSFKYKSGLQSVKWVISSGSFNRVSVFRTVGGFDKNYFIDRIDMDYCFSVRLKGFDVKVIEDITLEQSLGDVKSIFGVKFYEHSPIRNYYIARNRFYFILKHKNDLSFPYAKLFFATLRHLIKVVSLETNKKQKIKSICQGVIDCYSSKMGKSNQTL